MEESKSTPTRSTTENGTWIWLPQRASGSWLLPELLADLRRNRLRMLSAFVVGGLVLTIASFLMQTMFKSTAVVMPVGFQQVPSFAGVAGQLTGLAGLAGFTLPSASGNSDQVTLATLQSRAFLLEFAERRGLVEPLFARRFDAATKQWLDGLFGGEPTDDEIFEAMQKVFDIEQDTATGLVSISMKSPDASASRDWTAWLIDDLNESMRQRDILEAERAIEYLNKQIAQTSVSELRQILYRLVEDRTQTAMLANVSPEYALRVIDPPSISDKPSEPRRLLLAVLGAVAGSLLVLMWVLARFALRGE